MVKLNFLFMPQQIYFGEEGSLTAEMCRDNNMGAFGYPDSSGWVCRNEFLTVLV